MSEKSTIIMPETRQLKPRESNQQLMPADANPMQILQAAVARGVDTEQLEKLMALQERYEKNEARKAYFEAVAAFAQHPPTVIKDKTNPQYGSKYSSLENMVNTVSAALSPHGLSARWQIDQTQGIAVTCILSHVAGHSESVTISGPPDKSGSKNDLQQIKSTLTYLKLATFEAITGTASEIGNVDDDGNGAGKQKQHDPGDDPATDEQLAMIADYRAAEQIPDVTLKWLDKQEALTVKQAAALITKLNKANAK